MNRLKTLLAVACFGLMSAQVGCQSHSTASDLDGAYPPTADLGVADLDVTTDLQGANADSTSSTNPDLSSSDSMPVVSPAPHTWIPVSSGTSTFLIQAIAPSPNNFWALGWDRTVLQSSDARNWKPVAIPAEIQPGFPIDGIAGVGSEIYMISYDLWRSQDNGATWTKMPALKFQLHNIWTNGSSIYIVARSYSSKTTTDAVVIKSIDHGMTFQTVYDAPAPYQMDYNFNSVWGFSDQEVFVAGIGMVLHTKDGGATWIEDKMDAVSGGTVGGPTPNEVYFTGGHSTPTSPDAFQFNGTSWAPIDLHPGAPTLTSVFTWADPKQGTFLFLTSTSSEILWRPTGGTGAWVHDLNPGGQRLNAIASDGNIFFAVGANGTIVVRQ